MEAKGMVPLLYAVMGKSSASLPKWAIFGYTRGGVAVREISSILCSRDKKVIAKGRKRPLKGAKIAGIFRQSLRCHAP
jgi:hypothetical protein